VTGDTMDDVLVMAGREVQMLDGETGKEKWRWRSDAAGVIMRALVERKDNTVLIVACTPPRHPTKHAVQIVNLHLADGSPVAGATKAMSPPAEGSSKFCVASVLVGNEALVCLDGSREFVHAFDIEKQKSASVPTSSLLSGGCSASEALTLQEAGGAAAFVLKCGGEGVVVTVLESTRVFDLKAVHTFHNVPHPAPAPSSSRQLASPPAPPSPPPPLLPPALACHAMSSARIRAWRLSPPPCSDLA
jgi:hypothetical protein